MRMEQWLTGLNLDPALVHSLRSRLDTVDGMLADATRTTYPFLTEASQHLITVGGKRFRPLLTLLTGYCGDPARPELVRAATIIELTHLASLYHDDVVDESHVRRGAPSANAQWGNTVAILTGDYLFSQASHMAADLSRDAARSLSRTFARLCTGAIREAAGPTSDQDPVDHYFTVLSEKTGSLIATAAEWGGIFSGARSDDYPALARYGELLGMAFQVSDDILDLTAPTTVAGKMVGVDLRQGIRTLPILYALASADPGEARLRELLSMPLLNDSNRAEAVTLIRRSPAMEKTRDTLTSYVQRAISQLATLRHGLAKEALEQIAQLIIIRTY